MTKIPEAAVNDWGLGNAEPIVHETSVNYQSPITKEQVRLVVSKPDCIGILWEALTNTNPISTLD